MVYAPSFHSPWRSAMELTLIKMREYVYKLNAKDVFYLGSVAVAMWYYRLITAAKWADLYDLDLNRGRKWLLLWIIWVMLNR